MANNTYNKTCLSLQHLSTYNGMGEYKGEWKGGDIGIKVHIYYSNLTQIIPKYSWLNNNFNNSFLEIIFNYRFENIFFYY